MKILESFKCDYFAAYTHLVWNDGLYTTVAIPDYKKFPLHSMKLNPPSNGHFLADMLFSQLSAIVAPVRHVKVAARRINILHRPICIEHQIIVNKYFCPKLAPHF